MKTLDGFKDTVQGIKCSFECAIEKKKKQGEDIEMELKCLADCEKVLRYIKLYEVDIIG